MEEILVGNDDLNDELMTEEQQIKRYPNDESPTVEQKLERNKMNFFHDDNDGAEPEKGMSNSGDDK